MSGHQRTQLFEIVAQELFQALPVLFRGDGQFIAEDLEQHCFQSLTGIRVGKHGGDRMMHRPGRPCRLNQRFHLLCQAVQIDRHEAVHVDIDQRAVKIKEDRLNIIEANGAFNSFTEK